MIMNFNFEMILYIAVLISGALALADILYFSKRRNPSANMPIIFDYARSFFPILLAVFLLRAFLYEPFRIPSGSLKPTLAVGDFVLVNKYTYGIRLPILHKKILNVSDVKRGDIMVFRYPPNPSVDYIKRVIGLPGDHISYLNKILYINGKPIPQVFVKNATDDAEDEDQSWQVDQKEENLEGVVHQIYLNPEKTNDDIKDLVVPPDQYFVMGDNRDNSLDSRYWGFVPDDNIVGKASLVWMSWDKTADWMHKIRWNRIGQAIH
ncbi:MAG: signal peptidase I [Gammaproteobacteria bacterium]|nr:signal peptidase I [Gammaproteobacteria bacterium]